MSKSEISSYRHLYGGHHLYGRLFYQLSQRHTILKFIKCLSYSKILPKTFSLHSTITKKRQIPEESGSISYQSTWIEILRLKILFLISILLTHVLSITQIVYSILLYHVVV